jgi:hypothetical protein
LEVGVTPALALQSQAQLAAQLLPVLTAKHAKATS